MTANLAEQRQDLEEALAASVEREEKHKEAKEESDNIREQIQGVEDKMDEARDKWIEMLGGVTDWQGTAKDWAKGWLDAFKETGDGLGSLKENFDELYENLVVGQLWSRIMGPHLKQFQEAINNVLSDGKLTTDEAEYIKSLKGVLYGSNEELKSMAKSLGIGSRFEGENIQRGVETITEQTAQALESILNSTRHDVSETNVRVANIEAALTTEGENTILSHIRSQTRYLSDIAKIASAVYYPGGHPKGAGALKVITEMA